MDSESTCPVRSREKEKQQKIEIVGAQAQTIENLSITQGFLYPVLSVGWRKHISFNLFIVLFAENKLKKNNNP